MLENKILDKVSEETSDVLLEIIEFLAGAGPLASYFFGFATSQLWSMVEGMQIIVNYQALMINAPGNTALV